MAKQSEQYQQKKFLGSCAHQLKYDPNYPLKTLLPSYSKSEVLSWGFDIPQSLFEYLTEISRTIRVSRDVIHIKRTTFLNYLPKDAIKEYGDSQKFHLFMQNHALSIHFILVGGDMNTDHVLNLKNGMVYFYSLDIEFPYLNGLVAKYETFYDYVNEYVLSLQTKF